MRLTGERARCLVELRFVAVRAKDLEISPFFFVVAHVSPQPGGPRAKAVFLSVRRAVSVLVIHLKKREERHATAGALTVRFPATNKVENMVA